MRQHLHEDRGSIAEVVVVFPTLITVVLVLAQLALWAVATHTVQATASHALSATRVEDATERDGHAEATFVLDQLGPGPLRDITVQITRDSDRAEVRIEGTTMPVLPFLHLPVHAEAAGPTEEFEPAPTSPSTP
ncbi:pilus assembly protein [Streptomyces sp. NPDC127098]|uniref:pilus assembly protein n=1 Tax=Streptomyces sp. NPDC127098 TaxID=3347137 RepID=UPI0036632795